MTVIDPNVLLYAARYAIGRQTSAPRDVLSAIVLNVDNIRCNHQVRQEIVRLLTDEWAGEWDDELGQLRFNALRMLAAEEAA